eukprot:1398558-Amphidinium_carterae.1
MAGRSTLSLLTVSCRKKVWFRWATNRAAYKSAQTLLRELWVKERRLPAEAATLHGKLMHMEAQHFNPFGCVANEITGDVARGPRNVK